jgi:S-adenosylmethionine:diacylglycerol 3-amino-3-carboxypropyl transferase
VDLRQGSDRLDGPLPCARGAVVLVSAEGGDRVLRLLADGPARLVVVDRSPAQLRLAELKLAALRELGHAEYLEFAGLRPSARRRALYQRVRVRLPRESDDFWLARLGTIDRGVGTQGILDRRLERFLSFVRLVHGREKIDRFRALATESERRGMLDREWKTFLWRHLGGRLWERWFDVPPGRLERLLLEGRLLAPPPEPAPADFASARESASRALVAGEPEDALRGLPDGSVDVFALGRLDLRGLEAQIERCAAPGARIVLVAETAPSLRGVRFEGSGRDAGLHPGLEFGGVKVA